MRRPPIISRRVSAYRIGRSRPHRPRWWTTPDRWRRSWQAEADDWTDLGARRGWTKAHAERRMHRAIERACRRTHQTTWCYCPACDSELLHRCQSTPHADGSTSLRCPSCGHWSWWLLDTPAPVRLSDPLEPDCAEGCTRHATCRTGADA